MNVIDPLRAKLAAAQADPSYAVNVSLGTLTELVEQFDQLEGFCAHFLRTHSCICNWVAMTGGDPPCFICRVTDALKKVKGEA